MNWNTPDGLRSGCSANFPPDIFPMSFRLIWLRSGRLLVVEEHVVHGGVAQSLAIAPAGVGPGPTAVHHAEQHWAIPRVYMAHRSSTGANVVSTLHRFSTFSQPRIGSDGRAILEPCHPHWLSEFGGYRARFWFLVQAGSSGPT